MSARIDLWEHRTNTGRIVYRRPIHLVDMAMAFRILKKAVLPAYSGTGLEQRAWIYSQFKYIQPMFIIMESLYHDIVAREVQSEIKEPTNTSKDSRVRTYPPIYELLVYVVEYGTAIVNVLSSILGYLDVTKPLGWAVKTLLILLNFSNEEFKKKVPPYEMRDGKVKWL